MFHESFTEDLLFPRHYDSQIVGLFRRPMGYIGMWFYQTL